HPVGAVQREVERVQTGHEPVGPVRAGVGEVAVVEQAAEDVARPLLVGRGGGSGGHDAETTPVSVAPSRMCSGSPAGACTSTDPRATTPAPNVTSPRTT